MWAAALRRTAGAASAYTPCPSCHMMTSCSGRPASELALSVAMTPWAEAMPETTTRMAAMMAMRSTSSYSSAMSSTSIGPRNAAARAAAPSFASSGLGVGSGRETMVVDLGRRPIGVQELSGSVFNVPVRLDILHRCVRYLRAKWQQGTHKAKTRAEVSGGGRKPRPQKKTGRSRQGSIRSPLWRGGGATFGPRPRSHAHELPRNVQRLGMCCALSARAAEGRVVLAGALVSGNAQNAHALAPLLQGLAELGGGRPVLFVDLGEADPEGGRTLRTAARRVPGAAVMAVDQLTVYHVLRYRTLVLTTRAVCALERSLQPHSKKPLRSAWWRQEMAGYSRAADELRLAAIKSAVAPQSSAS